MSSPVTIRHVRRSFLVSLLYLVSPGITLGHAQEATDQIRIARDVAFASLVPPLAGDRFLDVYFRADANRAPVIVSLHGGSGSKDGPAYVEVSRRLAAEGAVVFNASYRAASPLAYAADNGVLLREALETVTCALRFANAHAAAFGGDATRVTVVGQSAGGYMGLLAAMLGEEMLATWHSFAEERGAAEQQVSCTASEGPAAANAFVGFNGAYFVFAFTGLPDADPDLWQLVDPQRYAEWHPSLTTRFILGTRDATQPPRHLEMVEEFSGLRRSLGYDSGVLRVDAQHAYSLEGEAWAATLRAILETLRY